jgi:MYXO-CTERM domain-containing protein
VATTTTEAGEGRPGVDEGSGPSPGDAVDDPEALDGEEAAARSAVDRDDGDARTWLAFAVLLALFGAAGWRIRRLRRQ